jgi:hypothetical protein
MQLEEDEGVHTVLQSQGTASIYPIFYVTQGVRTSEPSYPIKEVPNLTWYTAKSTVPITTIVDDQPLRELQVVKEVSGEANAI